MSSRKHKKAYVTKLKSQQQDKYAKIHQFKPYIVKTTINSLIPLYKQLFAALGIHQPEFYVFKDPIAKLIIIGDLINANQ